jgi:hypothetical protein
MFSPSANIDTHKVMNFQCKISNLCLMVIFTKCSREPPQCLINLSRHIVGYIVNQFSKNFQDFCLLTIKYKIEPADQVRICAQCFGLLKSLFPNPWFLRVLMQYIFKGGGGGLGIPTCSMNKLASFKYHLTWRISWVPNFKCFFLEC